MMKILLAEDEHDLARALITVLEHNNYEVDYVEDGAKAVEQAKDHAYDVMVLDIMMPHLDGMSALKEIRSSGDTTPVIFLTAKAEVDDRINGLDAGADDYLTKPFAIGELMARIKSVTRRRDYTPRVLQEGNVVLNLHEQELKSVNSIRLNHKEAKMMEYFMLNCHKSLSTDDIYHHVWKDDENADEELVYVYISYLNNKLDSVSGNLKIVGEEGQNYHLEVCE